MNIHLHPRWPRVACPVYSSFKAAEPQQRNCRDETKSIFIPVISRKGFLGLITRSKTAPWSFIHTPNWPRAPKTPIFPQSCRGFGSREPLTTAECSLRVKFLCASFNRWHLRWSFKGYEGISKKWNFLGASLTWGKQKLKPVQLFSYSSHCNSRSGCGDTPNLPKVLMNLSQASGFNWKQGILLIGFKT